MDTLVSMAVAVSFGWSVYALFTSGGADMSMRMSFGSTFGMAGSHPLYLDVAAGVPAAVLAGRYLEARARARSGAALTALAGLGARTVAVLREGTEQRVAVDTLGVGEQFAAVPMRSYPAAGAPSGPARTFLTIRNPTGHPDELLSVRSPVARHAVLRHNGRPGNPGSLVAGLTIPARTTVTLTPFGDDVVLTDPARFEGDGTVPLTLTFRHAGQVTVDAAVTAPGTP